MVITTGEEVEDPFVVFTRRIDKILTQPHYRKEGGIEFYSYNIVDPRVHSGLLRGMIGRLESHYQHRQATISQEGEFFHFRFSLD